MAIRVKCACGATLKVRDDLAGKRGRCPSCRQTVAIPQVVPVVEELRLAPPEVEPPAPPKPQSAAKAKLSDRCPECGAALEPRAVICISCGLNLQTGEQLRTRVEAGPDALELPPTMPWRAMGLGASVMGSLFLAGLVAAAFPTVACVVLLAPILLAAVVLFAGPHQFRFEIGRDAKGQKQVARTLSIGLLRFRKEFPLQPQDTVWYVQKPTEFDTSGGYLSVVLLGLATGCLPGLIYWLVVLRRQGETIVDYRVELVGERRNRRTLYSITDNKHAALSLARTLSQAAGLPLEEDLGMFG